mmetsp:Transcript_33939/g.84619  ORF Transcript_33939/g.84619 Transcript_33939/m.84619 type:complete len:461 (-) Transcript_33939:724-2106(-)
MKKSASVSNCSNVAGKSKTGAGVCGKDPGVGYGLRGTYVLGRSESSRSGMLRSEAVSARSRACLSSARPSASDNGVEAEADTASSEPGSCCGSMCPAGKFRIHARSGAAPASSIALAPKPPAPPSATQFCSALSVGCSDADIPGEFCGVNWRDCGASTAAVNNLPLSEAGSEAEAGGKTLDSPPRSAVWSGMLAELGTGGPTEGGGGKEAEGGVAVGGGAGCKTGCADEEDRVSGTPQLFPIGGTVGASAEPPDEVLPLLPPGCGCAPVGGGACLPPFSSASRLPLNAAAADGLLPAPGCTRAAAAARAICTAVSGATPAATTAAAVGGTAPALAGLTGEAGTGAEGFTGTPGFTVAPATVAAAGTGSRALAAAALAAAAARSFAACSCFFESLAAAASFAAASLSAFSSLRAAFLSVSGSGSSSESLRSDSSSAGRSSRPSSSYSASSSAKSASWFDSR